MTVLTRVITASLLPAVVSYAIYAAVVAGIPHGHWILATWCVIIIVSATPPGARLIEAFLGISRRMSPIEETHIAHSLARLHGDPLVKHITRVRIISGAHPHAEPVGDGLVYLSEPLITQVTTGLVGRDELDGILAGAAIANMDGHTRTERVLTFWCAPYHIALGFLDGLFTIVSALLPGLGFLWNNRIAAALVVAAINIASSRIAPAIAILVLIGITRLQPHLELRRDYARQTLVINHLTRRW